MMKKSDRKQLLILEMKEAITILETPNGELGTLHQLLLSIRKNSIKVDKNLNPGYWLYKGSGDVDEQSIEEDAK